MPQADKSSVADREQSPKSTLAEPNGGVAAMVEAEVNEGGLPSPETCDTPRDIACCSEAHHFTIEASAIPETCPAPQKAIQLPLGNALRDAKSSTLMKTAGLELIRLVIPAGKEIPAHRAPGEITVQCVEGLVAFNHDGKTIELQPGEMVHLCPREVHSLKGIEDSAVLVTRLRLHAEDPPEKFSAAMRPSRGAVP